MPSFASEGSSAAESYWFQDPGEAEQFEHPLVYQVSLSVFRLYIGLL